MLAFASAIILTLLTTTSTLEAFGISSTCQQRKTTADHQLLQRISHIVLRSSKHSLDPPVASHYTSPAVTDWLKQVLDSYHRETGHDLLPNHNSLSCEEQARAVALFSDAVASHDFFRDPEDPTFNYANVAFLEAFGYEWDEFVILPSRYCVENEKQMEDRRRILDNVRDGVEDESDLDGLIRVRKDGRRIILKGVTLWNVFDGKNDDPVGQAVWVERIESLD